MGSSVKDAHLHIGMEDSKTEKPGIWSASFAFGAVRRSTVVDEVCRCHARPAERSGLLARSPREIISTCWSHPSTASAPTSHDVHEGGWTSERLWSIRCTGRLCSHCGWKSDPARSTASQVVGTRPTRRPGAVHPAPSAPDVSRYRYRYRYCRSPMRLARYWSSPPLIRGSARALKTNGGPPASRGALVVRAPRKGPAV